MLCTAGWDCVVVAWDLSKRAERWRTRPNTFDRRVSAIAVSPSGTRIVAASLDGTARCFNVGGGRSESEHVDADGVPFNAVVWHSEDWVLLGDWTGRVTQWDPRGTFATVSMKVCNITLKFETFTTVIPLFALVKSHF